MSMFTRYVEKARVTIFNSKHEADRFGALEIVPEHILLGLLGDPDLVRGALEGISEEKLRNGIEAKLPRHEPNTRPHDLPLSKAARKALVLAEKEADKLGHQWIGNEHILLGLIEAENSDAAQLLRQEGVSADTIRSRASSR